MTDTQQVPAGISQLDGARGAIQWSQSFACKHEKSGCVPRTHTGSKAAEQGFASPGLLLGAGLQRQEGPWKFFDQLAWNTHKTPCSTKVGSED